MKVRFTLVLLFSLSSLFAIAQRYAVASGNWTDEIWASTYNGVPGSAAIPTASDDVFTNGFSVTVNSDVSCRNLNVRRDVPSSLVIEEFSFATLTINGYLSGANSAIPTPGTQPPTISDALVMGSFETIRLVGSGEKIRAWGYMCPLVNVTFTNSTGVNATITQGFRIANSGSLTLESGTLFISTNNSGRQLRGCSDCSLTVNSGATLNTLSGINGGGITTADDPSTSFGNITVDGTLTTGNYVNATNFSMGATGLFQTSFAGATQTEGWWYLTNRPTGGILNDASQIAYTAALSQNIYARQYGALVLQGSGTITKTVTGSGSLNISGDLILANTGITLNSPFPVVFNGNSDQTISGGGTANFNGGLQVNKTGGSLTLGQDIYVQSGLTVNAGIFDVSNHDLTLSGAIVNSATLTFGTGGSLGTLLVSGTTSVSGTVPSFGHLTVNGSLSSSGTINVAGNVTNNGSLNVSGINFNGTSPQTISGTLTLTTLTVSAGSNVSNLGTINMDPAAGVVTLVGTAAFDAGSGGANTLRLQSTSLSNGARIAALPNPDRFSGNVTVERYMTAPEDWEYLAFPVSNPNVGMLKDDIAVTGSFTDASGVGGNVVNSTSPSIYYLNAGWQAVGSGASTASTSLSGTIGYSVWSYLSSNVRLDVDGEIGKGPKGVAIRSGDNLVPNPYPSAIDWDLVNTSGANLSSSTIYVRTANGQYASYADGMATGNHPLGGLWKGQLATGQAFWVLGAGNGTLTFEEDDKSSSTNFVREAQPQDFLRIRLKKDTLSDDAIVHFKETATLGRDFDFDAPKKINDLALNISTYNEAPEVQYAINGVPFINCEFTTKVKLGANNPVGNYSLSFEDLSSMTTGYEIMLFDKFLDVSETIEEGANYPFSITSDPSSSGASRFELVFRSPSIDEARNLAIQSEVNCEDGTLSITIQNSQPGINYQFLYEGTTLNDPVLGNGGIVTSMLRSEILSSGGSYSLNILANSADGCHAYEYGNAFELQIEDIPVTTPVSATSACTVGNVTLIAGGAPVNGFYNWYETQDATTPIAGANGAEFITPEINKTTTYYVAAVNSVGCESSERIAMQAIVSQPIKPSITVEGDLLKVEEELGEYQWYLDGIVLEGATSNTYQVKKSGAYTVSTSADGCSVISEGFEYIVNGSEHKTLAGYYDVFPNPVQDIFTITGPDLDQSKISVFDRSGKEMEIQSSLERDSEGKWRFTANISRLRNGMYLLNIEKSSQVIQMKLIKR